jgi:probable HAF family extracellular repeat protein
MTFRTIVFALSLVFPGQALAQGYSAVDLGTLGGGGFSWAHAVNNKGQVVGRSSAPGTFSHHAFLWDAGVMTDLGTLPGGSYSEAFAVNDRGQVVGWGTVNEATCTGFDGCWHGFLWENGTMTDLGTLGAGFLSYAYSIDDEGTIVGISTRADYPFDQWHAVTWKDGVITDLGTVAGARQTMAFGINNRGTIAGSWTDASGQTFPLLWDRGAIAALPTLPGATYSEPYKINSRGQAVGVSRDRAVLWSAGTITDLGLLTGAAWSHARDINNQGQIVGKTFTGFIGYRAFVWQDGVMTALPGGTDSQANGINESGQIAGAFETGFGIHAVLWTRR